MTQADTPDERLTARRQTKAARDLETYLSNNHWRAESSGPLGRLWVFEGDADQRLGVSDDLAVHSVEWTAAIERLATLRAASVESLHDAILLRMVDVTRLRATGNYDDPDTIQYEAGSALVASGLRMLRSTATTSMRTRAVIASGFSKRGDEIVRRARMGHTEHGSFVVPVHMPLSDPEPTKTYDQPFPEVERRDLLEPAERRVMRTFAESLDAVRRVLVEPESEPTAKQIPYLVDAGASREFLVALNDVLAKPVLSEFSATFKWATALKEPNTPAAIEIPHAAVPRIQRATELLRKPTKIPGETLTGPVIMVRHEPGDPVGVIWIQAVRQGRQVEVEVRVNSERLDAVHEWMLREETVVVVGIITRSPGRRLLVEKPTVVEKLSDRFLDLNIKS